MAQKIIHIPSSITEHGDLNGRDAADQHPISAITDLQTELDGKEDDLGNPTEDGQLLSSTIAGVRTWTTVESGKLIYNVTQTAHGFLVDNIIALPGSLYVKANATDDTKVSIGIVIEVVGANEFKFQDSGELAYTAVALTTGNTYWLGIIDGELIDLKPANYIQPIFKATSATTAIINVEPMQVYGGAGGGGTGGPATGVTLDTTNFDNNLSVADDNVQKAMETLDDMSASGGGEVIAANEALVTSFGDDGTGIIGDGSKPFATPTEAWAAHRGAATANPIVLVRSGIFTAEDCWAADGIMMCEEGLVTLQTGGTNAMFKNTDGSYNGINYQVLGNPIIKKVGGAEIFQMTSTINYMKMRVESMTGFAQGIQITHLDMRFVNLDFAEIIAHKLNFYAQNLGAMVTSHVDGSLESVHSIHIVNYINDIPVGAVFGLSSSNTLPATANIKIENYVGTNQTLSTALRIGNSGSFFTTYNLDLNGIVDFPFRIDDAISGNNTFNISGKIVYTGVVGEPVISILIPDATSDYLFKGLELIHENNGLAIESANANTIDVTGTLAMITTADPKVDVNTTLNNIIDVPGGLAYVEAIITVDWIAENPIDIQALGFVDNKPFFVYYEIDSPLTEPLQVTCSVFDDNVFQKDSAQTASGLANKNSFLFTFMINGIDLTTFTGAGAGDSGTLSFVKIYQYK